jgi:hypothetical protein
MNHETILQNELLLAAPHQLPYLRLFRRNVLAVKIEGRSMKAGIKGQADIYGITRNVSRHIELELKSLTGRSTPEQKVWAAWCIEWGVPHLVLRPLKDESAKQTVTRWCHEIRQILR